MTRQRYRLETSYPMALALTGALLTLHGCSAGSPEGKAQLAVNGDGSTTPISELPFIDAASNAQLLGELLARPTRLAASTPSGKFQPAPMKSTVM